MSASTGNIVYLMFLAKCSRAHKHRRESFAKWVEEGPALPQSSCDGIPKYRTLSRATYRSHHHQEMREILHVARSYFWETEHLECLFGESTCLRMYAVYKWCVHKQLICIHVNNVYVFCLVPAAVDSSPKRGARPRGGLLLSPYPTHIEVCRQKSASPLTQCFWTRRRRRRNVDEL